ncbi:TPA: hypothetical protein QEM96_002734 [Pseudomonas putida]|nr:hypothetical protein [Pseudomonas putida]
MMEWGSFKAAAPETTAQQEWLEHSLSAVKKFLKNAVVIDNQPYVKDSKPNIVHELQLPDDGMSAVSSMESLGEELNTPDDDVAHRLDVRKISDSFAENGIACAFVLPDDSDTDETSVLRRVLNAAKISDIVVIDWYLQGSSPVLTMKLLAAIAAQDASESGRMRMICVYTGQPLSEGIFLDVKKALSDGGISLTDAADVQFCAKGNNCLVTVLNKVDVPPVNLPEAVTRLFTRLANGLVPSFALAAVGAIRKNTHHMVTRFGGVLDSAYIANRLITNPPGDVAELMRELLVAECDNALGLDRVADDYLENESVAKWLNFKQESFTVPQYKIGKGDSKQVVNVDRNVIDGLLNFGIRDRDFTVDGKTFIDFPEYQRNKIAVALSGGVEAATNAENEFSRLVVFRREAFGHSNLVSDANWKPSLTTGTVLRLQQEGRTRYLMCLTPACDALRIKEPRPFVFLEGLASNQPYNLVIKDLDGSSIGLYFDKKHPLISTFHFAPDEETQRVRAVEEKIEGEASRYSFKSMPGDSLSFSWLGEIRYGRAVSEMAGLASNWMRIGIIDSEYLRLAGKGSFKFGS